MTRPLFGHKRLPVLMFFKCRICRQRTRLADARTPTADTCAICDELADIARRVAESGNDPAFVRTVSERAYRLYFSLRGNRSAWRKVRRTIVNTCADCGLPIRDRLQAFSRVCHPCEWARASGGHAEGHTEIQTTENPQ